MESEIEITFELLTKNPEFLDKFIFSCLNGSYPKKVKNIVGYANKKLNFILDDHEKKVLSSLILIRIKEKISTGEIIKTDKGYISYKFR